MGGQRVTHAKTADFDEILSPGGDILNDSILPVRLRRWASTVPNNWPEWASYNFTSSALSSFFFQPNTYSPGFSAISANFHIALHNQEV